MCKNVEKGGGFGSCVEPYAILCVHASVFRGCCVFRFPWVIIQLLPRGSSVAGSVYRPSSRAPSSSNCLKTMAGFDSAAVIKDKAMALGLESRFITKLVDELKYDTLGKIAYCCAYQPGMADEEPWQAWAKTILGEGAADSQVAALRQLFHEANAASINRMREDLERREEHEPKRIPTAERSERYNKQQERLKGLRLVGELEPSNSLTDLVYQQYEQNVLKYVPPDACTTRQQELHHEKRARQVAVDENGQLTVKYVGSQLSARWSTDLLLKEAFTRRGLAYDQANLLDFHSHAAWVDGMFTNLHRETPDELRPVTPEQIIAADKALFLKMAEATRSGIRAQADGTRPLDQAIIRASEDPRVMFHLLPVPKPPAQAQSRTSSVDSGIVTKKGKGKAKGAAIQPPPGCVNRTSDGKNICYAYNNSAGCPYAKSGKRCNRGYHLCGREGCHGKHSILQCPKNTGSGS